MKKMYFTLDEDFEKIIKEAVKDKEIIDLKQISTGWTNIVYEVSTNDGNYFFRFPRDEFWSRTIVKDYEFAKYIYGKTDFNTSKLELLYNDGRPFSVHKKVEGTVLADRINDLTEEEIKTVSADISKFMFQLHNLEYTKNKIFNTKNIGVNLIDFLNELLNVHVSKRDKEFWNYEELMNEQNNCLVHGDLNSSNIIIDENAHVAAVIDFGFGGFSNKYLDIARIVGRECPEKFKNEVIKNYEELSNNKLNHNEISNKVNTWTNIDNAYINYMKEIGIY